MVKRIVLIIVVVVILIAVVNDIGRYIIVWYTLDETTREAARIAAANKEGRDAAAQAAVDYAATEDVTVYAYDEKDGRVYVWTEAELSGTWFLDSVLLVVQGGSLSEPYTLKADTTRARN
jgi:hypothetical protein